MAAVLPQAERHDRAIERMAAVLIVACCFLPVIFALWLILMMLFAGLISGAMSILHHP